MKTVKHVCKYCNRAEEYTKIELAFTTLYQIMLGLLCSIGTITVIYISIVGAGVTMEMMTNVMYAEQSSDEFDELKLLTLDITKLCDGDNSACYTRELYNNVSGIRYVPSSATKPIQSPLFTYAHGGDCKNSAYMFTSMLKTVGIPSRIACSVDEGHCISVVKYGDKNIIVDLTSPQAVILDKDEDCWDYMEKGIVVNHHRLKTVA